MNPTIHNNCSFEFPKLRFPNQWYTVSLFYFSERGGTHEEKEKVRRFIKKRMIDVTTQRRYNNVGTEELGHRW